MKNCPLCGNEYTAEQIKQKEVLKAQEKTYFVEGVKHSAKLLPYNDAFFEIVSGKHKGNLVHTFDVKK